MGKYLGPQGTEPRKTCKKPGCKVKIVKKGHMYCYEHFIEFRSWLHETDRKIGNLLEAEYRDGTVARTGTREHAEINGEFWPDDETDSVLDGESEWPSVKL